MKWAKRINKLKELNSEDKIQQSVALAALDCFVAAISDPEVRVKMSQTICAQLNINNDTVRVFLCVLLVCAPLWPVLLKNVISVVAF